MIIRVNGKEESTETKSLVEYLESKNIDGKTIIIELNEQILKRDELSGVVLNDNDQIEIIRFVGGG